MEGSSPALEERRFEVTASRQLAVRKASGAYVPVTCWAVALCEESHCNSFQILHVLAPRRSEQRSTRATEAVRDRGFSSAAAASTADDAAILTHREAEVLKLLAGGRTTHEVAAALSMSVNTIRTHTQNVLRKLNTRTPTGRCRGSRSAARQTSQLLICSFWTKKIGNHFKFQPELERLRCIVMRCEAILATDAPVSPLT